MGKHSRSRSKTPSRGRSSYRTPRSAKRFRTAVSIGRSLSTGSYASAASSAIGHILSERSMNRKDAAITAGLKQSDVAGRMTKTVKFFKKKKLPKTMRVLGPHLYFQNNNSGGVFVNNNLQGWEDFELGNASDVLLCGVEASKQLQYTANGTFFNGNLNPYGKVWMDSMSIEIIWVNSTTTAQRLTIYDLLPARDLDNPSPVSLMTPTGAGTINSYDAANDVTGDVTKISTPGTGPFDGAALRGNFNLIRTREMWLAPGEVHTHKFFIKLNKMIFLQPYQSLSVGMQKGCGGVCLFRYLSAPVSGSGGGTTVGLSSGRFYSITRYKFRSGVQQGPHYETVNQPTALIGNEQYIDEATDQFFAQTTGFANTISA